ncbi:MAG: hypothetical protein KZQ64_13510 [gamma proteobacterium symbiont of Bathyaustriella thionipta]|nr:hypothetical protein [gamma proteobacterium symbiont of Bathyaustriella thionipta]MCU7949650.1 hypothetical protein [gamma proteobacterium symbiont of Bathyaustriella thionipta]MCU7954386.1 hypothetical protein [gamma proteobacterium symbiont of Bathyaustriella thionipta]MCU7956229.1 hypothetical protein [gamma proteobacterium symbiont of Bathyaustriella thionipta]
MPFIKRNSKKQIIGIFSDEQDDAQEELSVNDKEIIEFLESEDYSEYTNHLLNQSDSDFIRVLEDLIDVLLDKHILLLTDLPEAAQQKLLKRKKIRKDHIQSIISDDDDNIF